MKIPVPTPATRRWPRFLAALSIILLVSLSATPRARAAAAASDNPCNTSSAIANGLNTGAGFAAWTGVTGDFYYGGSGISGDACTSHDWGMYDGGGTTSAQRPFTAGDGVSSLQVGQTITVDMENGGIQNGGSEGMSLWNASGNAVFELYFAGGAMYWTVHDASGSLTNDAIPYAGSGCRVFFTLTSSTTYSLTVQVAVGGTSHGPFTGTLINPSGGQAITQLRFYTFDIGGGNNLQVGQLGVSCPTPTVTTQPASTSVCSGGTASFTAASTNASSPTYQWQISTNSGANWSNVSGGTGATTTNYTTAATTSSMNGDEYRCVVTDACGTVVDSSAATLTVNTTPTVATTNLPALTIGSPYSNTVSATGGSGYTWSISAGALPSGLGINSSNGVISGTYNGPGGTASFTVEVETSSGCVATQALLIAEDCSAAITITPSSLPNGTVAASYGTQTLSGNGGSAPYTFAVTSGSLPAGLSLNTNTGAITGTPTSDAAQTFTIVATDSNGCIGTQTYTVMPVCPTITVSGAPPSGTNDIAYSGATFTALGANGVYSFSVTSGSLPPGLTLSTNGALSGTPVGAGAYNFTVTATDTSGCTGSESNSVTIYCPVINVSPTNLPVESINAAYTVTFTSSGGAGASTFTNSSGSLPAGLRLSTNGVLSGTPTNTGVYAFTIMATDTNGCTGSEAYSVTVTNAAPAILTNPAPQTACSGSPATFTVAATGTDDGYAWYQHANAGWGSAWSATGSGAVFLGSSTDNDNGASNCNTFSGNGDINTSSGNSWGLYGGASGDELVSRTFPSALTNGQIFQIDMDNGFVDTGKQVGFSLHNAAGNDLFSFYFNGGSSDYIYFDESGTNNTSVGYTANGLRIVVVVGPGNPASYAVFVTPCGGGTVEYSGTLASTNLPASVLLYNHNTDGGNNYNLYFNSIYAGTAYDNADNYSSGWSGDKGDDSPIAGATNSTYVTSTGNNGDLYYAIAYNAVGDEASTNALLTVNPGPIITTASPLPAGTLGTAYSVSLTASNGAAPYSFGAGSGLPPGVSLSTNGVLSGTPTVSGAYNFTVTVTDSSGTHCESSSNLSVTMNCPTITVSPNALPTVNIGVPYSQMVTASGGTSPYTLAVTSGALPAGLSLTNGVISGTYNGSPGSASFTITATDSNSCTGSQAYMLNLLSCPTIAISPPTLPNGTVAASYGTQTLTPSGGASPYNFAITSGMLPAGLSFNTNTGVITGTPTSDAAQSFMVTATDSNGCTGIQNYTVTPACPAIIVSGAPPPGTTGSNYAGTNFTAVGANGSYTFGVTSGSLPPGLALSSGGVLSGTPTAAGTYNFTVTATDSSGCAGSESNSVTISCPTITVSPSSLPNFVLNAAIGNLSVSASGGNSPYTYSFGGTPPPGLLFNTNTGALSGTPTNSGPYSFSVTATDSNGCAASASYSLTVGAPPSVAVEPTNASICTGSTATFAASVSGDGTISYAWRKTGGGWGFPWSVSGNNFLGSSTDNDQGNPACSSFGNADINSSSGQAWGMYGPATATRGFPALAAGQAFRIDMDNGNVDTGAKNGFRLQQSSNTNDLFRFYFLGGQANYKYFDSAGEHDTGIPFTLTGVRVEFLPGASSAYTLVVTPCGGAPSQFFGALPAGTINQVLLECNNAGGNCGGCDNLYFNNLLAGTDDDNAGFYTGSLGSAGNTDLGSQLAAAGLATNSSYTTPVLNYPGDNGNVYQLLAYSPYGATFSSQAAATVNPYPVAPASAVSTNVMPTLDLTINIAAVLSNWTGSGLTIQSVATNSAQGGSVSFDATNIYYAPPTNSITNDSFTYTVANASGCATPATINVTFVPQGGIAESIIATAGSATIVFYGIPGVQYDVQRTTSLSNPDWVTLTLGAPITCGTNELYTFTDTNAPAGNAFYRALQH